MLFATQAYAQTADAGQDEFLFWGKIGWLIAVIVVGIAIWYFKGRRKQSN